MMMMMMNCDDDDEEEDKILILPNRDDCFDMRVEGQCCCDLFCDAEE